MNHTFLKLALMASLLTTSALATPGENSLPAWQTLLPSSYQTFLQQEGGSHFIRVRDSYMHYVESGPQEQPTLLLLHGSPDNIYIWRKIMPILAQRYHVVAVDLIGFGLSGQPTGIYTWQLENDYLSSFIEALKLKNITLVGTDIGGLFAFNYAAQNPSNVKGLAFFETLTEPFANAKAVCKGCEFFLALKDPQQRAAYTTNNPGLAKQTYGQLKPEDFAAYAFTLSTPRSREIAGEIGADFPIAGEPQGSFQTASTFAKYLRTSPVPKLVLYGNPGLTMPEAVVKSYQAAMPNLTAVYVGAGEHYLAEDQPQAIAQAILSWRDQLR
ncbi:MAG: alpha/beta fold hydrolase [Thermaceae bacterium]|nr:alpha/beta fold hydrolase [Thermaceae bacterium]